LGDLASTLIIQWENNVDRRIRFSPQYARASRDINGGKPCRCKSLVIENRGHFLHSTRACARGGPEESSLVLRMTGRPDAGRPLGAPTSFGDIRPPRHHCPWPSASDDHVNQGGLTSTAPSATSVIGADGLDDERRLVGLVFHCRAQLLARHVDPYGSGGEAERGPIDGDLARAAEEAAEL
jgi:hypothetical protein